MINLIFLFQGDAGGIGGIVTSLFPFLLIILIFYFLIIRPQQKRARDRQALLDAVKKGDKVVTSGGIYGTVEGIEDKTLLVKIADNVKVKIERSAVSTIVGVTPEEKK